MEPVRDIPIDHKLANQVDSNMYKLMERAQELSQQVLEIYKVCEELGMEAYKFIPYDVPETLEACVRRVNIDTSRLDDDELLEKLNKLPSHQRKWFTEDLSVEKLMKN